MKTVINLDEFTSKLLLLIEANEKSHSAENTVAIKG